MHSGGVWCMWRTLVSKNAVGFFLAVILTGTPESQSLWIYSGGRMLQWSYWNDNSAQPFWNVDIFHQKFPKRLRPRVWVKADDHVNEAQVSSPKQHDNGERFARGSCRATQQFEHATLSSAPWSLSCLWLLECSSLLWVASTRLREVWWCMCYVENIANS